MVRRTPRRPDERPQWSSVSVIGLTISVLALAFSSIGCQIIVSYVVFNDTQQPIVVEVRDLCSEGCEAFEREPPSGVLLGRRATHGADPLVQVVWTPEDCSARFTLVPGQAASVYRWNSSSQQRSVISLVASAETGDELGTVDGLVVASNLDHRSRSLEVLPLSMVGER